MNTLEAFQLFLKNPYVRIVMVIAAIILMTGLVEFLIMRSNRKRGLDIKLNFLSETRLVRRLLVVGILFSLIVSLDYITLSDNWKQLIRKSFVTVILYFCWRITSSGFRVFLNRIVYSFTFRNLNQLKRKNLIEVIEKTTNIALLILFAVVALNVWGVQVGPLLTGLGIAGVAIGLALQDILTNIFGGISLSLDDAFREDEMIELSTGETGIVYQVGYRSTKIKTFNEEIIVVPNNKLTQMNIRNLSRPTQNYRLSLPLTVEYGTDIDYVKGLILETLKSIEGVLDFPDPDVVLEKLGDNGLGLKIYAQIRSPLEKGKVTDSILSNVYRALRENRIELAYTVRKVLMTGQKPVEPGVESFEFK